MSDHVTVELDVAWEDPRPVEEVIASMLEPRSRVLADTDRTNCCAAEEVWFEDAAYYGCDYCRRGTRPAIEHEVVLTSGPGGGWPIVAFHGPTPMIEQMLERHGYADGLDAYAVEYEEK